MGLAPELELTKFFYSVTRSGLPKSISYQYIGWTQPKMGEFMEGSEPKSIDEYRKRYFSYFPFLFLLILYHH